MREHVTILILCSVAGAALADQKKPAKPAKVDPKADELLHRMSDSLAATKRFQFDADHVLEAVTEEGEMLQFVAASRVSVERPNRARSDRLGAIADATLYYDGDSITIYGKRAGLYATKEAPGTLDEALDFTRDELALEAPAADLLYSDVYGGLMEDVVSGRYVGLEPVGGRMCHHLAYRGNETDWQIWIEDNPRAFPCRYVIRSKTVKGAPTFQVAFSGWNANPKLAADFFDFKPPTNAKQIEFLAPELREMRDTRKNNGKRGRQL